jgi:CRP-like cAMP-binding protein
MTSEPLLTLVEKTAFLKSVPVLSAIPTEPLAELASRAREVVADPGEVLFRVGDPNQGAYLVLQGMLQLRRGDAVVRVLGAGMAFGELWRSDGAPHEYEMIAIETTHALNFTSDDVFEAMHEYPEFGVAMVQAFALRVHEVTSRVLDLENVIARLTEELHRHGIELPELPATLIQPATAGQQMFGATLAPWPGLPGRAASKVAPAQAPATAVTEGAPPPARSPAAPAKPESRT